jgi:hypothetical protein
MHTVEWLIQTDGSFCAFVRDPPTFSAFFVILRCEGRKARATVPLRGNGAGISAKSCANVSIT